MRDDALPPDVPSADRVSPIDPFSAIEQRILSFAERHPGMPTRAVIASRLLHHLYGCVESANNAVLEPFGLTTTTWMALVMIYARGTGGELKPSELSRAIAASRAHVTRVADFLEQGGWIARRPCSEDRRVSYLTVTPQGEALVERILPPMFALHESLWKGFSDEERTAFETVARKLAARAASFLPGVA
jgi:DNA-binding MarR family transcriptional regulator